MKLKEMQSGPKIATSKNFASSAPGCDEPPGLARRGKTPPGPLH